MKLLHGLSLLLLGCSCYGQTILQKTGVGRHLQEADAWLEGASEQDATVNSNAAEACSNLITGGDAETGQLTDWLAEGSGSIAFDSDAPFGSTRSYKMSGRTTVNTGPGQSIDINCLELGRQYKISAQIKIMDVNGTAVTCDKNAQWLDPNFCPLFTIWAMTPNGEARLNLGSDLASHVEWVAGGWNPYEAIFTVDDRLASAGDTLAYFRGPRPDVDIYFDDVSVVEYLGLDTRYNFWTSAPPPEGTSDTDCVATTIAESSGATADILLVSNITYQYHTDAVYNASSECIVVNGDAESGFIDGWVSVGAEGGIISMHNVGPEGSQMSFMHVDRPNQNSGPGQENIDMTCFDLNKRYELKAKVKLVDENGFPYACDKNPSTSTCSTSCPVFMFVHLSNGDEQHLPIPNDIADSWIAEEFNEYHAIFEVTQTFLDSIAPGFFFKGPRAGVGIIFDDVSIKEYVGPLNTTAIPATDVLGGPCSSLVTSGNAETGNISDWEIKDEVSGEFIISLEAPEGITRSYQHKSRTHVSSGPGQDLDLSCLVPGKQYILTAQVKIMDEQFGSYACDKFAIWRDPDFCPIFTIWVNETDGRSARLNLGNDYPLFETWQENQFNPYHAIFTVDDRLAATDYAYLYLRGPRPGATMYFTDVELKEYVGTDTRNNFWTSLVPSVNDTEVAASLPEWNQTDPYPTVPERDGYLYYNDTYQNEEASNIPCVQLVKNGDAEPAITDGWSTLGTGGGEILLHPEGPTNQTQSFKHIGRSTFNSGPGQGLELPCLELGKIYEVKAKIKLYDQNGFPLRCIGNIWRDDLSCPIFTIYAKLPSGDWKYISKWNDMQQGWYADYFNEFHALFQVDTDLLGATEAYWYFRGPRADISIAVDDVSIRLYEHQVDLQQTTVVRPPGCQELTFNGDASVGSLSGWIAHDGSGFVSIDEDGPQGFDGPTFKTVARSHATNGPGQAVNIACLENGRRYKVTASFFLIDGRGDPFQCHTAATWNTPYFCPMFSVYVDQPWGAVRWNFVNQLPHAPTAGWNDFETEFVVDRGNEWPDHGYAYFRGPAKDVEIYFNNVTITMIGDVPPRPQLNIPARDPNFSCTSFCCEMVENGGAEDSNGGSNIEGWVTRPENNGSLMVHSVGADGTPSSIKHIDRGLLNSGPGQFLDVSCFVPDQFYEIQAKVMILDENEQPYTCDKHVDWNDPAFCPMFSIWYNTVDYVGNNYWFDVPNNDTSLWVAGEFNNYQAIFQMTGNLMESIEASFMFRGLPIGAQIIVDSVSLSPYMHEPTYQPPPEDLPPQFDFFVSSTTFEVNPFRIPACDIPIFNGDFETGTTTGWFVNNGGTLGIVRCDANGGEFCLKTTDRESTYFGPKALLGLDCLQAGRTFVISAQIKLMDSNWQPASCDKLAGRHSLCPIFTLHYTTAAGEEKWIYSANLVPSPWDRNIYNDFSAKFVVSDELASASRAFFYFERVAPEVSILLDNVSIKELITEADTDYQLMTKDTCEKLVLNGNFETAELRGWMPRFGGELVRLDGGADLTQHSVMHTGRSSFMMGPMHDLAVNCLIGGMKYNFESKMKLIDDETGQPFLCDKTKLWIDDDSCPLLTFQLTLADGSQKWMYFNSETKEDWRADSWNFFQSSFIIDESLVGATSGRFYMERVKAGVAIVLDEVSITRDCSVLVPNHDAEVDSISPWYQHGEGQISIVAGGSNGSPNTFASTGRIADNAGPTHMLDVDCLTLGSMYVYSAQFKLLDATNGYTPFMCDKNADYGTEFSCPYFTLVLTLPGVTTPKYYMFPNIDQSDWVADGFNHFAAEFEITDEIQTATAAKMIFNGPRAGISILFDDATLELKVAGECENLIPNGHFENITELIDWRVADVGNLTFVPGGFNSNYAMMCSARSATNDGPISQISNMCIYEGVVYEFEAQLKLLDANNNPFACDKSAAYGTPLACPILAIEMQTGSQHIMVHPENTVSDPWVADGWNAFRTVFVVSNDLANAETAHFKFKGPAPGVSIVFDDVSTSLYQHARVNCNQLIYNTNAENGFTSGWHATGGGYIEAIEGGDNSTKAFAHFGRGSHNSGPEQNVETLCLQVGQVYDLNARFKFVDYSGNPVGCDKTAHWRDPNFCLMFTFELKIGDQTKHVNIGNNYGAPWITNEFNSFRNVLTIDEDFVNADSIFFWIRGPTEDKVIIFDNISLKLQEPVVG